MATTPCCRELPLLPERFATSQLAARAPIPEWATQGTFFSFTRRGDGLSVVCEESRVPAGSRSQPGWGVLKVQGPFVLTEIAVLAALASPLAEVQLGLFTIPRFETDYLRVASQTLSAAIAALEKAGPKIHRS